MKWFARELTLFAIAFAKSDLKAKIDTTIEHSPYQGHWFPVPVIHRTFKQFCPLIKHDRKKGYYTRIKRFARSNDSFHNRLG